MGGAAGRAAAARAGACYVGARGEEVAWRCARGEPAVARSARRCLSVRTNNGVTHEGMHARCGRLMALTYLHLGGVRSLTADGLRAVGGPLAVPTQPPAAKVKFTHGETRTRERRCGLAAARSSSRLLSRLRKTSPKGLAVHLLSAFLRATGGFDKR